VTSRSPLARAFGPVLPVLRDLHAAGIRFLVAGARAGILHGHRRKTLDFDLCVRTEVRSLDLVLDILDRHGFRALDVLDAVEFSQAVNARFAGQVHLDFLVHPLGFDFASAWERHETVEIEGVDVHFVALEDLLAMKRAAGRAKDVGDLEALEEIRRLREVRARAARRHQMIGSKPRTTITRSAPLPHVEKKKSPVPGSR
jgi:predicted nucleotidyltransferase